LLPQGHFDVQPAEPLALWSSPPFAPTRFEHPADGPSLRARGAADDKGCLAAALQGLQAVSAAAGGAFPVNLKFLLEGQEEIGSPQLESFIQSHGARTDAHARSLISVAVCALTHARTPLCVCVYAAALLAADLAVSADGEQHSATQPALTLGAPLQHTRSAYKTTRSPLFFSLSLSSLLRAGYRGAVALQLTVRTAAGDLHSGSYGGSVANAAHVLASLLSELHRAQDGAVAAPRFYDDVTPLTAEERAAMDALPLDEAEDKAAAGARATHVRCICDACARVCVCAHVRPSRAGVSAYYGETGFGTLERRWCAPRPSRCPCNVARCACGACCCFHASPLLTHAAPGVSRTGRAPLRR
jgi:acetylornithine deacetylase/succinyl-diaminopimelate desuccinylase-like protein